MIANQLKEEAMMSNFKPKYQEFVDPPVPKTYNLDYLGLEKKEISRKSERNPVKN